MASQVPFDSVKVKSKMSTCDREIKPGGLASEKSIFKFESAVSFI